MRIGRHILGFATLFGAIAGSAGIAEAGPIPYPTAGTPNSAVYSFTAASTGEVIAYFAGSTASYTESVGMRVNGVLSSAGFGLNNKTTQNGASFDFGAVNAGDVLVFVLNVTSPALGFVYSDPSLNTSYDLGSATSHNHIYSTSYTASPSLAGVPSGTFVAFEDLPFPNSDYNYNDETFVFTNVAAATTVPEAASLTLLASGLAAFGFVRRNRQTAA